MSRKNTSPWPDSEMFSGRPALSGEATTCARHSLDDFARLRQNGRRLAKRRQALESNLPRNSQPETHRKAVAGAGRGLPQRRSSPLSIDFPMPPKTRMTTLQTASGRARAGCRWFHDRRLWFGSDALQAGTGWHSANHGSIGDSRPTAFLGYPRGHTVALETWRYTQSRLTRL